MAKSEPPVNEPWVRKRPYRPRKPPEALELDYGGEMGILVVRTHDLEEATRLAVESAQREGWDGLPEGRAVWVKLVPWCICGESHDYEWITMPAGAKGATPGVEFRW